MRGKGGFLRIVEAFIAIMIIAGVLSFIYVSQVQKPNKEESIRQIQQIILDRISSDPDLRTAVLEGDSNSQSPTAQTSRETLETEIGKFIPPDFEYEFKICPINEACGCENCNYEKEIFAEEISVSSTLDIGYDPKVIRIFMWERD